MNNVVSPKWVKSHHYSWVSFGTWKRTDHFCFSLVFLLLCVSWYFHMFSICFHNCWDTQRFITHSPQPSHPSTAQGLCLPLWCLQSIVSFQGHFNAVQKFANQLFWSSAYQTGLSSSSVQPVSLFVRFFCHSSSGWQRSCTSDPSSFSRLFFIITSKKTGCQSERLSAVVQDSIRSEVERETQYICDILRH